MIKRILVETGTVLLLSCLFAAGISGGLLLAEKLDTSCDYERSEEFIGPVSPRCR